MLHEHWREYTDAEILEYKRKVCIAHKCIYLKHFNSDEQVNAYCDYLCMTGKVRKERPEDCEHWREKEPPRNETRPARAFLTKEEHDWIREKVPVVKFKQTGYHLK